MNPLSLVPAGLSFGVGAVIVLIVVIAILRALYFKNVGAKEIAIKERRYWGKPMPAGRVVATKGEVGIQADVLKPGLHFLWFPFERIVDTVELIQIGSNQIGIVEAIDGAPLPAGRIFAPDKAENKHNNFQDPIAFLQNGGVKGIQMRTLPPGSWPIHPYLFRVSIAEVTVVPQGQVGVVTASDGAQLDTGRLLAKVTEGHDHFQDAEAFISKDGQKGPQVEILTPGTYRIHTDSRPVGGNRARRDDEPVARVKSGIFKIEYKPATVVEADCVGLVEALDGQQMDVNDFVAEPVEGHNNFQNGSAFILKGGKRGPQQDILLPGTYYINPLLFTVIPDQARTVNAGEVAVVISNEGADPTETQKQEVAKEEEARLDALRTEHPVEKVDPVSEPDTEASSAEPPVVAAIVDVADKRLDKGVKEAYVVPEGCRGIQKKVLGPGRYYINPRAKTVVIVATTNQTVEWTKPTEAATASDKQAFDPFEVVSKDGFKMELEVMVVFRVRPEDAPYMVSKIGGIDLLKTNVIHPVIDSIFRNQASGSSAMQYLQDRHQEQLRAEANVRMHLTPYHVEVVNVLIRHIHLPEELMNTQTQKIIADQQKSMYITQEEAQQKRISLMKTTAQADKQADLMAEVIGVDIAEKRAEQRKKNGEGEAAFILATGTAEANVISLKGAATGAAYRKQVDALGPGGVALVQVIKAIAEGKVKITPDILVTGGGKDGDGANGTLGGLVTLLLADKAKEKFEPAPEVAEPAPAVVEEVVAVVETAAPAEPGPNAPVSGEVAKPGDQADKK